MGHLNLKLILKLFLVKSRDLIQSVSKIKAIITVMKEIFL